MDPDGSGNILQLDEVGGVAAAAPTHYATTQVFPCNNRRICNALKDLEVMHYIPLYNLEVFRHVYSLDDL